MCPLLLLIILKLRCALSPLIKVLFIMKLILFLDFPETHLRLIESSTYNAFSTGIIILRYISKSILVVIYVEIMTSLPAYVIRICGLASYLEVEIRFTLLVYRYYLFDQLLAFIVTSNCRDVQIWD